MQTKLATLKNAAAAQDWQGALRIAAKFADLGEHKAAIVRGHEAHSNARFAAQLGRDPAADIEAGIQALCARYSLNRDGTESTAPKAYGAKNNCIRAARKALGAEAQPGEHFTLAQGEAGWTWAAVAAEPAPAPAAAPVAAGPAPARKPEVTAADLTAALSARKAAPAAPAAAPAAEPAPKAPRAPKPEIDAKRRAMLAAADAKGFGPRWAEALAAAGRGELPEAPDFTKPTHVSGRTWLAQAQALVAAGDAAGLRGLVFDPEGSTGGMLYRYVRFATFALEARADLAAAA